MSGCLRTSLVKIPVATNAHRGSHRHPRRGYMAEAPVPLGPDVSSCSVSSRGIVLRTCRRHRLFGWHPEALQGTSHRGHLAARVYNSACPERSTVANVERHVTDIPVWYLLALVNHRLCNASEVVLTGGHNLSSGISTVKSKSRCSMASVSRLF